MQVVPVVPWSIARIMRGRLSTARPDGPAEVPQLAGTVKEAAEGAAGGAVGQRQLDLLHPVAEADRVHGHSQLHAEAAGEREQGAQGRGSHRPLARDRRRGAEAGEPLDPAPGVAERDPETASLAPG